MIRIVADDALRAIPRLVSEGVVVDSIITDPPYHLTARVSRFGKEGSAPPQYGNDGAMGRLSKGFMGKQWDGGDIAFRPETWATIGTVLRPGGFMLVFGGTRTYHRMTCAIEDSGFIVQDCIMWLYGTGFPKRRDMLKPAYEPICVAYKPGGGRTMQIDECRIGTFENLNGGAYAVSGLERTDDWGAHNGYRRNQGLMFKQPEGRWPANICHDGSDEVISMFPNSLNGHTPNRRGVGGISTNGHSGQVGVQEVLHGSGSASRFFWSPKAGKKDRAESKHPTVKPVKLLDWLVPLVTPIGGSVLDPFAGSGTTGVAAQSNGRNAILIEREPEYVADIRRRFPTKEEALREFTKVLQSYL